MIWTTNDHWPIQVGLQVVARQVNSLSNPPVVGMSLRITHPGDDGAAPEDYARVVDKAWAVILGKLPIGNFLA